MESALGALLLENHGINIQKLRTRSCNWHVCVTPDAIASRFGWSGECCYYLRDLNTGDLVVVNNFYNGAPPDAIPLADYKSPIERAYEGLTWLEQVAFPGTFTWKFVQFPFLQQGDFHLIKGVTFHRGSCFLSALQMPQSKCSSQEGHTFSAEEEAQIHAQRKGEEIRAAQAACHCFQTGNWNKKDTTTFHCPRAPAATIAAHQARASASSGPCSISTVETPSLTGCALSST